MPNARTVTVRTVAADPVSPRVASERGAVSVRGSRIDAAIEPRAVAGPKLMAGYDVVSEMTVTQWLDANGRPHRLTTVDALEGAVFERRSWEHWTDTGTEEWTWGSEHCADFDAGCGPSRMVKQSAAGAVTGCDAAAVGTGIGVMTGCTAVVAAATAISLKAGVAFSISTAGVSTVSAAVGAAVMGGVGSTLCALTGVAVAVVTEPICEAAVDALSEDGPQAPEPTAIRPQLSDVIGEPTACQSLGGEVYDGPPILVGGGCAEPAESDEGSSRQVTLSAEDDSLPAPLEIEVWGDPLVCENPTMITAADDICVIVN
jgi:hypothetical protein